MTPFQQACRILLGKPYDVEPQACPICGKPATAQQGIATVVYRCEDGHPFSVSK